MVCFSVCSETTLSVILILNEIFHSITENFKIHGYNNSIWRTREKD